MCSGRGIGRCEFFFFFLFFLFFVFVGEGANWVVTGISLHDAIGWRSCPPLLTCLGPAALRLRMTSSCCRLSLLWVASLGV